MPKVNSAFNRIQYNKEYEKNNYYRLNVVLPKDMRPVIDGAVSQYGKSKNAFIREAIEEKIEREKL